MMKMTPFQLDKRKILIKGVRQELNGINFHVRNAKTVAKWKCAPCISRGRRFETEQVEEICNVLAVLACYRNQAESPFLLGNSNFKKFLN